MCVCVCVFGVVSYSGPGTGPFGFVVERSRNLRWLYVQNFDVEFCRHKLIFVGGVSGGVGAAL